MEDSIAKNNERTLLENIESLEQTIDELIDYASTLVYNDGALTDKVDQFMKFNSLSYIQNYDKSNIEANSQKPISKKDKTLIKNELIFNILFDMYQRDIGDMTLNGYCSYMCKNFMDLTVPEHKYIKKTYGENPSNKYEKQQFASILKKL